MNTEVATQSLHSSRHDDYAGFLDRPSTASRMSQTPSHLCDGDGGGDSEDESSKTNESGSHDPTRRRTGNSEASARFRRRRKEREQQTQQKLRDAEYTIRYLEDSVKELETENMVLRDLVSSDGCTGGSRLRSRRRYI